MLNGLIRWSVENRLLVVLGMLVTLGVGGYLALQLPIDVFPDLTAPTVTVITEVHNMAPEEVETVVTFPIETALNGSTGVRRVRSVSGIGISIVWVEFDWGIDIYRARQVVSEKLQLTQGALPPDVPAPVLAPISSIMGEILLIGVTGRPDQLMEMRTVADWTVRRRILALAGVSQVIPLGGEVKQYQVLVDPERLHRHRLTLKDIMESAASSIRNSSGGFYSSSGSEYLIRGLGRGVSLDELRRTPVGVERRPSVRLEDVGDVVIGPKVRRGIGSINGEEAVVLAVLKQPEADTLALTDQIEAVLDEIEGTLPEGIGLERTIFRQSDFIQLAVANVLKALRDGAILVVLILFAFLLNFRTTFISITAIPLSLLFTVVVFWFFGVTINTMTLGGMAIAIGALVDDAIIDVENVFRRLRLNLRLGERAKTADQVIYEASSEVRSPIMFATFIVIVVFVPLFALSGLEGRMLRPLGVSYIVSIFGSLLVALTVTPALCSYLLPRSSSLLRGQESAVVRFLRKVYSPSLNWTLAHPTPILCSALVLLILALVSVPFMGRTFLPEFNEGTLTITQLTLPGTSLEESDRLGATAERIMLSNPEVLSTARRTGRAELDEHAQEVNGAEIDVRFQLNDRDRAEFLNALRTQLSIIPGTVFSIGQPISHRIDHMLSGTRAAIAVKLFGPDLLTLRNLAKQIRESMSRVPGVVDLQVEPQTHVPQLQIRLDRDAVAAHGFDLDSVHEVIDVGINGEVVGQVFEDHRAWDLLVRLSEDYRTNPDEIGVIRVESPSGASVPLGQLAEIGLDSGPNRISRESVQRKIVIQCNVAERDLRATVNGIREAIEREIVLPEGYDVVYGGQFESEEEATRLVGILSVLAILAVFFLLFVAFSSLRLAVLMMSNLPLALIGGVAAVFLGGGILSIASMVGFITLLGIATRNGILLVSRYEDLLKEGYSLTEAILEGSMDRLNPILMTALTAGLALIPLALAGHKSGNEIQAPLAVVVLGGLLSSTFLNMIVVPALCSKFYPEDRVGRAGRHEVIAEKERTV
ncbi:MAG: efflux RND transporter permease subunit [Acidobacteriota bacterium]|nr:MAG: efflux RND transporter permease subunit [Acidobacteriota bacterium]